MRISLSAALYVLCMRIILDVPELSPFIKSFLAYCRGIPDPGCCGWDERDPSQPGGMSLPFYRGSYPHTRPRYESDIRPLMPGPLRVPKIDLGGVVADPDALMLELLHDLFSAKVRILL